MSDLHHHTALELSKLLRSKQISCEELTRTCLHRIDQVNPTLHAFVRVFHRSALRQARTLDRQLARSNPSELPLFWGVPVGIKDIDLVRGALTQMGSRLYRYLWSPVDSPVTRLFRRAGFVFVGKLATSEFAVMPITETDIHPPCRNPWAPDFTPGGSSGGSASAVAAGMLPIAHASDGAGSIRIPAAFCHLYGLKPSRGLLPNFYHPVDFYGMSTVNAVSHTVEDTAMILDALTQRTYDPAQPPEDSFLAQALQDPPALRIRYCTTSSICSVEPQIAEAVEQVARVLQELGHKVEQGPTFDGSVEEFLPTWSRQAANIPAFRESILQPATQWLRKEGRQYSKQDAWQRAVALEQRILDWFGDVDIWLTPTVAQYPPPVGSCRDLSGQEAFTKVIPLGAFTAIFNISGQPAANIPMGLSSHNLPFGVQLTAQRGHDATLLALSRQLQSAIPWSQRRSPLFE